MNDQTLHHFMQDLSQLVIGVAFVYGIVWVIGVIAAARKRRVDSQRRADLYARILDKFGSATEFVDYLQSESGQKFFDELAAEGESPFYKLLGSIQKGIILALTSAGFLILVNVFRSSLDGDFYATLLVFGGVGLMLGIGFLVSAGVTYRLSKAWGLLKTKNLSAKDAVRSSSAANETV